MKPIRKDTITILIAAIIVFVAIDLAESIKAAQHGGKSRGAKQGSSQRKGGGKSRNKKGGSAVVAEQEPQAFSTQPQPPVTTEQPVATPAPTPTPAPAPVPVVQPTATVEEQAPVSLLSSTADSSGMPSSMVSSAPPAQSQVTFKQPKTTKPKIITIKAVKYEPLADVSSVEQLYADVFIILGGDDVSEIGKVLQQAQTTLMLEVISRIMNDINSPLIPSGKIKLIFDLAHRFTKNQKIQDFLFTLLMNRPELVNHKPPLLLIVAHSLYADQIGNFIKFRSRHLQAKNSQAIALLDAEMNALNGAIDGNDPKVLSVLLNGIKISAAQATKLLWRVVVEGKNSVMVKLLVVRGAQVDSLNDTQQTPLMVAAAHNKGALVKALLAAKARVDYKDPNGIDALFIAIDNGHLEIEALLREHGAQE